MKVKVPCDNCGTILDKYPSNVREHNFCNMKCAGQYRHKYNFEIINNNNTSQLRKIKEFAKIRKELMQV